TVTVDDGTTTTQTTFDVTVTAVSDAPIGVVASNFTAINEDDFTSAGKLVSAFTTTTSDPDSGAVKGIAVTAADNSNGMWEYTLNGTNWFAIGNVSDTSARLLPSDATTRVRFVPDPDYNGVAFPFSVVAWDQTTGVAGGLADASVRGGTTAFSTSSATVGHAVNPINDAATIAGLVGDALAYGQGSGPLVVEQGADALVADIDSTDFDLGNLTVSITAGNDPAEDVLSIRNQGMGAGQIGFAAGNVFYSGIQIGTPAGGSGGGDLVVTLDPNATPTALTALVRNITYENTDTNSPTVGARTLRFTVNDGDGATSSTHDATVTVNAVNDAPNNSMAMETLIRISLAPHLIQANSFGSRTTVHRLPRLTNTRCPTATRGHWQSQSMTWITMARSMLSLLSLTMTQSTFTKMTADTWRLSQLTKTHSSSSRRVPVTRSR
ncbi:MAG: hypothetical protein O3A00_25230, partial [Planctomycetota bacterium]|nr:hypothetical protein [Planctomycetota bacterium]